MILTFVTTNFLSLYILMAEWLLLEVQRDIRTQV